MSVFVFDIGSQNMVKITKRGKNYYTYRLKEVQEIPKRGHSFMYGDYTYKFIWESNAINKYSYKPYEERDVSHTPDIYINDIKRWTPFKIRKMI